MAEGIPCWPAGETNSREATPREHEPVALECTCRLGDINGNGAREPGDVRPLAMELNGNAPARLETRVCDLDGKDAAEPGDVQILNNILNGLPVP